MDKDQVLEFYTCSRCNKTYKKTVSDAEALAEHKQLFPEAEHDPMEIICDDCFVRFMAWFKTLSSEDKRKIREESMH